MQIRLLPYRAEYAERLYRWRNSESSVRHNPLIPLGYEAFCERLGGAGDDLRELWTRADFRWFVEADGELAGNVTLKEINKMMLSAEIGYNIGEEFQGRGIATLAVRALIEKVFSETELRKLIALVHDQNLASCRVLEKNGFQSEGLLREHFLINGEPANEIIFGLLRREWRISDPRSSQP